MVEGLQITYGRGVSDPTSSAYGSAGVSSRFALASLTKPLVAVACLIAQEEGVLDLAAPVSRLLSSHAPMGGDTTLIDLLAHASGLPADDAAARRLQLDDRATWSEVRDAYLAVEPVVAARTRRIYSNTGYAVAAVALERATGIDYREYITEAVLIPLGMTATTFGVETEDLNVLSVVEPGLLGHSQQLFNGSRFRLLGLPQSGAYGTAEDYLRFLTMVLRGGRLPDGRMLLAPESVSELLTNQCGALSGGVGEFMEWERCDWAIGFELRDAKTPHWTGTALSASAATHFGASGTLAFVDPEHDLAAVVLANRGTYTRWMLEPGGWPEICAALVG